MKNRYQNKTWKIGNDLTVNRFGFGAMRLTGNGIWGEPKSEEECIRVLKRAVELGVNFIDTADSYGPFVSERIIAKALYPYPTGLVIATKGGQTRPGPDQWVIDGNPDRLKQALEGSLKRLKVDRIDLYQLHRLNRKVPFDETMDFLKQAQDEGFIKYIGLSEVSVEDISRAREYIEIVSVQNKFSFHYRKWEAELQYCAANDIAFIPWNPIDAGKLKVNESVRDIAKRYGATDWQIALKWMFNYSGNILLIPGTSSVSHLEENLKAGDIPLAQFDFDLINQEE